MRIAPDLLDAVVAHAVRDAPEECCGVVAVRDGTAEAVHPLENLAASSFRFEVDGLALHRLLSEIEDGGPRSAPSTTRTRARIPFPRRPTSTSRPGGRAPSG